MSINSINSSVFANAAYGSIQKTSTITSELAAGVFTDKQASENSAFKYSSQNSVTGYTGSSDETAKTNFYAQLIGGVSEGSHAEEAEVSSAEQDFLEFMEKTPEERMWELFLKEKGLTEEEYDNLPPEEKIKIEEEFKQKVEEKVKQNMDATFI